MKETPINQLDFRNPEVRAYTRATIDHLIQDYGIGYFKIDYNINAFVGTDYNYKEYVQLLEGVPVADENIQKRRKV